MAASRNSSPADPLPGLAAWLRPRLPAGAELWVGLSGGRDSVVLLHLLRQLLPSGQLRAVHVHHGLSPHADAWAGFCAELCRDWSIPLTLQRVQVSRAPGPGLEAAARQARYQAYRDCGIRYLALAHHRRDQAETLLFNLCRGTGVAGAAAMPGQRAWQDMVLLRPLLAWSGAAVAAYGVRHGLAWVEDESNQDQAYSRNFLRHRVLPLLESRFPAAEATLARAAGHFAEARELLAELAAQDQLLVQGRVAPLLNLSPARQANWLRHWLAAAGWHPPEAAALAEALRQLAVTPADGHFELCLAEGAVRLWRGQLYRVPRPGPLPAPCAWDGSGVLDWGGGRLQLRPGAAGIRPDALLGRRLELRSRQGGECLRLGPGRPSRPLKKLLQESGVPPWERPLLPLLFLDGELLACPGVGVAAAWQSGAGEPGLLPCWEGPGLSCGD